jgi:hypothetical protein
MIMALGLALGGGRALSRPNAGGMRVSSTFLRPTVAQVTLSINN